MSDEKILTLHPTGKKGVRISAIKYHQLKEFILHSLEHNPGMTFKELGERAQNQLAGHFEGDVLWYLITVKLDLEARNAIERVPKSSPQLLRLKK